MEKRRTSWSRIAGMSAMVSVAAVLASLVWQVHTIGLLLWLFLFGAWAGWHSRWHGWLSGIIVGLPLSLMQITRLVIKDFGSLSAALAQPEYWYLAVPACVASLGMAIMGGISGAWLQTMKLHKEG